MGTYVLAAEKEKMFDEIGLVMNRPEIKEKFRAALYQNGDLEEIRKLSMEIREQVRQLLKNMKHMQSSRKEKP